MTLRPLESFRAGIAPLMSVRPIGRVRRIDEDGLLITGLESSARLGDEAVCRTAQGGVRAEIVALGQTGARAMPYDGVDGLSLGAPVELAGSPMIAPSDSWLGRVVDPFGHPLDGRPLRAGVPLPIRAAPPSPGERAGFGARLATGYVALDTVLPIAEGQRIGLFAGSGVGKSRLLGDLARDMEADIVVAALIGERGREVSAFARDTMGAAGMARAVVVAATSDRPANVRRRALPTALTIAERFRDRGARVLLVCDSLTRHAEAYADIMGQPDRGLSAGLVAEIAAYVERAGPGAAGRRAITAIFSVLVAGSDMEGPIADAVRGLLDGHVVLSRAIAEAGRYPAIDALASVSRSLPDVASAEENALIRQARETLETYSRNELMVTSGLYEAGRNPLIDDAIRKRPALDRVLTARSDTPQASFAQLRAALGG